MAKKFYVVWQGRNPGVYTDWSECQKQVHQFAGARFKSFPSQAQAEAAFAGAGPVAGAASGGDPATPKRRSARRTTLGSCTEADIASMSLDTKIFTDGGCEPNPGEAGSGVAVYRGDVLSELWYGLYNPAGTNNTAELNALHQALRMAYREIEQQRSVGIFCDSRYSIQCVTQWAQGWQKKGWTRPGGEIKNLELIKTMFALYQTLGARVDVLHVNGHVGIEGNELADRMSMLAIATREADFVAYQQPLDVDVILSMRAG